MKPAETSILDEIETRLGFITTDNGYSLTLKKITRAKLTAFVAGDIPAANFWPVRHSRGNDEYGVDTHTLRIVVDVRDQTRDNNFADLAAGMIADVITALHRQSSAPKVSDPIDECFTGTVNDVSLQDSGYQIGEGQKPWLGAVIEVEVVYKSPLGDMFNYSA